MAQPWQRRYLLWVVTGWTIRPFGSRHGTVQSSRVLLRSQSLHLPFSRVYSILGRLARDETYSSEKLAVPPSMPSCSERLWEVVMSLRKIGSHRGDFVEGSWLNSYPRHGLSLSWIKVADRLFGSLWKGRDSAENTVLRIMRIIQ